MKLTIEGFAYCRPAANYMNDKPNVINGFAFDYCNTSTEGWEGYIHAGTAQLVIDLPDGFDPRVKVVDVLQRQKQQIMASMQERINEIDAQIHKFTALEMA